MRMSLKAVFFDIDDTLFSTTDFAERARRGAADAMRRHGLRLPTDHILRELSEVIAEFSSNYEHHFDKLLLRLPRRAFDGVNPAILVAAGVHAYHDAKVHQLRPYPDVPPVLQKLSRTDLVRGIITSGLQQKQADKVLRLGLYEYFTPTAIFISDQIGINKPNPKLYRRACSDLNLKPARCVYVGDRPRSDVDPPNALGMVTVQMKRGNRHEREEGKTKPAYEVRDFDELRAILERDFGFELSGARPAPPGVDVQLQPSV